MVSQLFEVSKSPVTLLILAKRAVFRARTSDLTNLDEAGTFVKSQSTWKTNAVLKQTYQGLCLLQRSS